MTKKIIITLIIMITTGSCQAMNQQSNVFKTYPGLMAALHQPNRYTFDDIIKNIKEKQPKNMAKQYFGEIKTEFNTKTGPSLSARMFPNAKYKDPSQQTAMISAHVYALVIGVGINIVVAPLWMYFFSNNNFKDAAKAFSPIIPITALCAGSLALNVIKNQAAHNKFDRFHIKQEIEENTKEI